MANTRTEEWSFMRQIPTEIRLLIYEHALGSKHAVKKRMGKPTSNSGDGLHPVRKRFALLFASKQVFSEAFPLLYQEWWQVNTISITHMEFCNLANTKRHLDLGQLQNLKIRLDSDRKKTWMKCEVCECIDDMVYKIASARFPALHTAVVQFSEDWRDLEMTRKELQRTGMDFEFTKVGQFRVTEVRKDVEITFEDEALASFWQYVAALAASHTGFEHFEREIVRSPLKASVAIDILKIFARSKPGLTADTVTNLAKYQHLPISSGVSPAWLEPEYQNAKTLEIITVCLEQLAQRSI